EPEPRDPAATGSAHRRHQRIQRQGAPYHDLRKAISPGFWRRRDRHAGGEALWAVECHARKPDQLFPRRRIRRRAGVARGELQTDRINTDMKINLLNNPRCLRWTIACCVAVSMGCAQQPIKTTSADLLPCEGM